MGELIAFSLLSAVIIGGALCVVLLQNLFRSAIALAFTFVGVAGLYLLLHAEFVAAIQVLIYVGAVTVLILFAVMLTSQIGSILPETSQMQKIMGLFCAGGIFIVMVSTILTRSWTNGPPAPPLENPLSAIGLLMLTDFLLPFELMSVILLAVLIGAVVIARKDDREPESGGLPK